MGCNLCAQKASAAFLAACEGRSPLACPLVTYHGPKHLLLCSAPDGSLSFRLEDARHLIGGPSPPKLVVVNSPHNPSVRCARCAIAAAVQLPACVWHSDGQRRWRSLPLCATFL